MEHHPDGGTESSVRVYFCVGVRQRLTASWAIRVATWWDVSHVCVSDGRTVLDPSPVGDRFIEERRFVFGYPGLRYGYEVRAQRPIRLHDHKPRPRPPFLVSVLRWLTLGLLPANDCVSVVCRHLRDAGVAIPATVTTPKALFVALHRFGGTLVRFPD